MKVPFKKSKYAGKELHECPTEYLDWMASELDTSHARFGESNQKLVDECHRILNTRTDSAPKPKNAATGLKRAQTGPSSTIFKELTQHLKRIFEEVTDAQSKIDVYTEKNGHTVHSEEHSPY